MMFSDMLKPKFYALLFVLAIFIAGCRDLLYDEGFVKMAATTNKLTKVADIGPFHWPNEDLKQGDIRFYPDQNDYSRGFLVIIREQELVFNYLLPTGVICFDSVYVSLNGENSPFFIMPYADMPGTIRVIYDYGTAKMRTLVYTNGTVNGDAFDEFWATTILTNFNNALLFNGSVADLVNFFPSPVDDNFYFCGFSGTSISEMSGYNDPNNLNTFTGFSYTMPGGGFASLTHPGTKWQPYVHNVANGKSYLTQAGSKGPEVYSWDAGSMASPKLLSTLSRPIDYALSTKHILSRDIDTLYVYDEAGGNEFRIPMGELYFVYENTGKDSGTELLFSHVGLVPNQHDNRRDELFVKVYTLPSRDIEKLK